MHDLLAGLLFGVAGVAFAALGVWVWIERKGDERRRSVRSKCSMMVRRGNKMSEGRRDAFVKRMKKMFG